jgi:tetratricopeptide (TPR) repeat protein
MVEPNALQAILTFIPINETTLLSLTGRGVGGEGALTALHHAYGGNAKAMDIISGAILEDFSGNVEAYWQANQDDLLIERDLEDLVTQQFDRLRQLDPDAYNLLCRMGCYRYQDVPTVPIEGLFCLLWDVPENRHRRVIKSLQDRSLVDFADGEFWLHPVIRIESISRIRNDENWQASNQKSAEFWIKLSHNIETINDSLSVLEAYHHYIEINYLEKALNLLTKRTRSKWGTFDSFILSCLRLRLHKKLLIAVEKVINHIKADDSLATAYSLLAKIYVDKGLVYQSLEFHELANSIASRVLRDMERTNLENFRLSSTKLEMVWVQLSYLFESAMYFIYLWRFRDALEYAESLKAFTLSILEEVDQICCLHPQNIDFSISLDLIRGLCIFIEIFLAYIYIFLDRKEEAKQLVKDYEERIFSAVLTSSIKGLAIFFIGFIHQNLGNDLKAREKFYMGLSYAKEIGHSRIESLFLIGLSRLYRTENHLAKALSHNLKSLEILNQGDMKLHLPEAYYELGLTYQTMGEIEKSNENFQKAIQLFSEMGAPKQVERVRKAMENNV